MSLTASIFGRDSLIFKGANLGTFGIAGYLDKQLNPETPAQRLGDISQQTAKEAEPRTIVWGRVRPIGGNIIHCQTPVKRMVKVKVDSGGKGGGSKKKTEKVEHVFRTYAIGVCEGPITGFVRIWRNNKLVYDARGNAWGDKNNPVFLKSFRLYTGAWDQMPAPALENIWGVGNVPAYRGTAYMVSIDEDLTETSGMVPQWQFEVERAEGSYLTSKLYKVETKEHVGISPRIEQAEIRDMVQYGYGEDYISIAPSIEQVLIEGPYEYAEYVGITPSIEQVLIEGPYLYAEYVAITPSIEKVLFSVSDESSVDYVAIEPSIEEVIIE